MDPYYLHTSGETVLFDSMFVVENVGVILLHSGTYKASVIYPRDNFIDNKHYVTISHKKYDERDFEGVTRCGTPMIDLSVYQDQEYKLVENDEGPTMEFVNGERIIFGYDETTREIIIKIGEMGHTFPVDSKFTLWKESRKTDDESHEFKFIVLVIGERFLEFRESMSNLYYTDVLIDTDPKKMIVVVPEQDYDDVIALAERMELLE